MSTQNDANQVKSKFIYKNRFGPNITKISLSYLFIITAGITTFYFAKREINESRAEALRVKKEIDTYKEKYPNRFELLEREKSAKNTTSNSN
jgi:hypothetical protein